MSPVKDIEFFEDKEGYIVLAVMMGDGLIDYMDLPKFQSEFKKEGARAEKVLNNAVWPIYPDPRPFMDWNDLNLLLDIEKTIREFIYLPREEIYNTLACWILFTYIHDHEEIIHAPRLIVHGLKKTAKSRLLELLSFLSYRGFLLDDPTKAGIFRAIELFHITTIIDEYGALNKEQRKDVDVILRSGFDRDRKVVRAPSDNSEWPLTYNLYGPAAAGGKDWNPPDDIIERSIRIEMAKKPREIEVRRRKARLSDVQDLRARLLAFRLKVLSGKIDIAAFTDQVEEEIEGGILVETEDGEEEILLDDRGLDIAAALTVPGMVFDDYQDMLREVARTQAKAMDTTKGTFDADVLEALLTEIEKQAEQMSVFDEEHSIVVMKKVTTQALNKRLNDYLAGSGNIDPKKSIHTRTTSNILQDRFGFDLLVGQGAGRKTIFDPRTFWDRLDRVMDSFGYSKEDRDYFRKYLNRRPEEEK